MIEKKFVAIYNGFWGFCDRLNPSYIKTIFVVLFNCDLIYLFIHGDVIIPYCYMWLVHNPKDEVEVSLVVYVNFIAACQVHCIIHLHWKLCR